MKIIAKSNFDKETQSDELIADNILNEYYGEMIVRFLNESSGDHSPNFYKLVPDDYVLYVWEP